MCYMGHSLFGVRWKGGSKTKIREIFEKERDLFVKWNIDENVRLLLGRILHIEDRLIHLERAGQSLSGRPLNQE